MHGDSIGKEHLEKPDHSTGWSQQFPAFKTSVTHYRASTTYPQEQANVVLTAADPQSQPSHAPSRMAGLWAPAHRDRARWESGVNVRWGAHSNALAGSSDSPSAPVGVAGLPALGTYLSARRVD